MKNLLGLVSVAATLIVSAAGLPQPDGNTRAIEGNNGHTGLERRSPLEARSASACIELDGVCVIGITDCCYGLTCVYHTCVISVAKNYCNPPKPRKPPAKFCKEPDRGLRRRPVSDTAEAEKDTNVRAIEGNNDVVDDLGRRTCLRNQEGCDDRVLKRTCCPDLFCLDNKVCVTGRLYNMCMRKPRGQCTRTPEHELAVSDESESKDDGHARAIEDNNNGHTGLERRSPLEARSASACIELNGVCVTGITDCCPGLACVYHTCVMSRPKIYCDPAKKPIPKDCRNHYKELRRPAVSDTTEAEKDGNARAVEDNNNHAGLERRSPVEPRSPMEEGDCIPMGGWCRDAHKCCPGSRCVSNERCRRYHGGLRASDTAESEADGNARAVEANNNHETAPERHSPMEKRACKPAGEWCHPTFGLQCCPPMRCAGDRTSRRQCE
jgi:hypothetical protein